MSPHTLHERLTFAYVLRATQYYAAGRHASLAQLSPVNATLLHHAVELFLKGGLLSFLPLEEIESIRHNLKRLWRTFAEHYQDSTLSEHKSAVGALQKFERIRYPDAEVLKGMTGQFAILREEFVTVSKTNSPSLPRFDLVLEDVDHLVLVILTIMNANPVAYYQCLSPVARQSINERNAHPWPTGA